MLDNIDKRIGILDEQFKAWNQMEMSGKINFAYKFLQRIGFQISISINTFLLQRSISTLSQKDIAQYYEQIDKKINASLEKINADNLESSAPEIGQQLRIWKTQLDMRNLENHYSGTISKYFKSFAAAISPIFNKDLAKKIDGIIGKKEHLTEDSFTLSQVNLSMLMQGFNKQSEETFHGALNVYKQKIKNYYLKKNDGFKEEIESLIGEEKEKINIERKDTLSKIKLLSDNERKSYERKEKLILERDDILLLEKKVYSESYKNQIQQEKNRILQEETRYLNGLKELEESTKDHALLLNWLQTNQEEKSNILKLEKEINEMDKFISGKETIEKEILNEEENIILITKERHLLEEKAKKLDEKESNLKTTVTNEFISKLNQRNEKEFYKNEEDKYQAVNMLHEKELNTIKNIVKIKREINDKLNQLDDNHSAKAFLSKTSNCLEEILVSVKEVIGKTNSLIPKESIDNCILDLKNGIKENRLFIQKHNKKTNDLSSILKNEIVIFNNLMRDSTIFTKDKLEGNRRKIEENKIFLERMKNYQPNEDLKLLVYRNKEDQTFVRMVFEDKKINEIFAAVAQRGWVWTAPTIDQNPQEIQKSYKGHYSDKDLYLLVNLAGIHNKQKAAAKIKKEDIEFMNNLLIAIESTLQIMLLESQISTLEVLKEGTEQRNSQVNDILNACC